MLKQSKITTVLLMSAILFTAAIAASTTLMLDADALKSSGTPISKIGSKTVCGDRMCSEWEGGRAGYEAAKKLQQ